MAGRGRRPLTAEELAQIGHSAPTAIASEDGRRVIAWRYDDASPVVGGSVTWPVVTRDEALAAATRRRRRR